jgi:AcrR family transcriptional regulator
VTSDTKDPRIARTRERALEAAEHLLFTEGLARVTFDGVRKETGISRSTLYRHWSRPIDLVIETWERNTRPLEFPETDDLRVDLTTAMNSTVDFLTRSPLGGCISALIDMAAHDPDMAQLHASFTTERRQAAMARLQRSIDSGELNPDTDPAQITDLLFGPIFYRHLLSHEPTSATYVEQLVDLVLGSVAA